MFGFCYRLGRKQGLLSYLYRSEIFLLGCTVVELVICVIESSGNVCSVDVRVSVIEILG